MKFISCLTLHAVVTHYNEQSFNALSVINHYLEDHMKHTVWAAHRVSECYSTGCQPLFVQKNTKSIYFILSIVIVLFSRLNFPKWFISSA